MKSRNLSYYVNFVIENKGSAFFYTPPFYKNAKSYLFKNPQIIKSITLKNNIEETLNEVDELLKDFKAYSILNYEFSYLLEPGLKLKKFKIKHDEVLGKFVFFNSDGILKINSSKILGDTDSIKQVQKLIKNFRLNISKKNYVKGISKIKSYIEEGDTYQVNFTVKGRFKTNCDINDLFSVLVFNQSARYIAIINNDDKIVISISPELFFKNKYKKITVVPMKGTLKRGINIEEDKTQKEILFKSEKNRAENLMIVDLLRNDIGKISNYGSVKVEKLFNIEKYETLFQMISVIKSELINPSISEVIKNIFPCGSITGAPKIRTMEIINELEKESRGIYTGAIGIIEKNKSIFNVAIRTIVIDPKNGTGEIGLGGGIVWDSKPDEEYNELLLKGKYLTSPEKQFVIIETMLVENKKVFLLNAHLRRLKKATKYFMFAYNKKRTNEIINKAIKNLDNKNYKLRLELDKWGNYKISTSIIENQEGKIKVIISDKQILTKNRFQYFKTSNRDLYNKEYKKYTKKGYFDVLFFNENNEITEGSISNIIVVKDGVKYTPPVSAGILNGVYRDRRIKKGKVKEQKLYINDLIYADKIILVNSVRKETQVNEVWYGGKRIVSSE